MKTCKGRGETKPLEQFYRAAGTADGYRNDCIPCNLSAKRNWAARDPQANRDRGLRWQLENPERYKAKQREYVERGQKQLWDRKSYLKRTYGMTSPTTRSCSEPQGGVCAIWGEPRPEERTLHIDHDHVTGKIRGLLCFRCNNALGDFREKFELFQAPADYLDRDDELAASARDRARTLTP